MPPAAPSHTVLLVPVPVLEPWVRARWEYYAPAWVSRDPAFTHAHVTVLAPWVPAPSAADLAAVAEVVAAVPAFAFELATVTAFADGLLHLVPSPAAPFAALTAALVERFPGHPPYAGAFPDPVPHLTLDQASPTVSAGSVRASLGDLLPATCRAERVELHRYAEGDCRVLASWPLSAPA